VMVTWQAEENIGKQSIMLDLKSEAGKKVVRQLLSKADIALANKHDAQVEAMGIGRSTLDSIVESGGKGPKIIQLQVTARRGEEMRGVQAANWPGYDPALQGKTGIMERFGPQGSPTFHGVASCVDYLTGYTACFSGLTALYAREANGVVSERAGTSLACCATLVQCNMQGDSPVVRGPWARGRTALNRIYQVGQPKTPENADPEYWIYAQAGRDLCDEAKAFRGTREEFLEQLRKEGVLAVPVHTCKQIAEISKTEASKTLRFEKREAEGLFTETWKPTWFCFNGVPSVCPGPAAPSGVHAPLILMQECGYSEAEVLDLYKRGVAVPIYWDRNAGPESSWKDEYVWRQGAGQGKRTGFREQVRKAGGCFKLSAAPFEPSKRAGPNAGA